MAAILVLHNWLTIDQRIIFIGLVYTQLRNTDTKIIHFRKNRDTLEHFQKRRLYSGHLGFTQNAQQIALVPQRI